MKQVANINKENAILASTVAIRTVISFFLEKEIEKFNSSEKMTPE
jgi:uncharacterized membrane protein